MSSSRVIMSEEGRPFDLVWSETTSLEGAPPGSAEPRGRGISVSTSAEIQQVPNWPGKVVWAKLVTKTQPDPEPS